MSIKSFFSRLKNSTWHQKYHILLGFLITFLMYILGVNIVFSVLFGFASGLLAELAYCYSPVKEYKIFGLKIHIIDYTALKNSLINLNIVSRHEFDDGNFFYNLIGVVLSVILKIILFFL